MNTASDTFYDQSISRPTTLPVASQPVRAASSAPTLRAAAPEKTADSWLGPNGGATRNGRLPHALAAGEWTVRRRITLAADVRATTVLATSDRLLAYGEEEWQLFDREGRSLANSLLGRGDVFLDPANGAFYYSDRSGLIVARRLSDAGEVFSLIAHFGDAFRRTLMVREGAKLLIASVEEPSDPFQRTRPSISIAELHDLGSPMTNGDGMLLTSAQLAANLIRRTTNMHAAYAPGTLWLAYPGRLVLTDGDLKARGDYTADFTPVALSTDETGRAHLVAEVPAAARDIGPRRVLWIVTPQGERAVEVELPAAMSKLCAPPLIGYDHRVYLVAPERLLCLSADGKPVWDKHASSVSGASVTADGQLLVSDGSDVVAFSGDGRPRRLADVSPEVLSTAPLVLGSGEILAASEKTLFTIGPRDSRR